MVQMDEKKWTSSQYHLRERVGCRMDFIQFLVNS